jgi:hypothetical protein
MTKLEPNLEALAEMRKLVASLGGSPLPEPSGWAACDDCNQTAAVYPYGKVDVCARDWHRRDVCRQLAIRADL